MEPVGFFGFGKGSSGLGAEPTRQPILVRGATIPPRSKACP